MVSVPDITTIYLVFNEYNGDLENAISTPIFIVKTRKEKKRMNSTNSVRCKKCGAIRKNKAADDDDMNLLIDLSTKQY